MRPRISAVLGARLRSFRNAGGLSGPRLAELMGISQAQVSRIESGKRHISTDDVRRWLDNVGAAAEEYDDTVALAERAEIEVTEWRELRAQGWDGHQSLYSELEQTAVAIKLYQADCIPGLLQTANYAHYLMHDVLHVADNEMESAVNARLRRQGLLYREGTHLDVIIGEHLLRQRLGGAAVMAEQLNHIAVLARLPSVRLGVLPLGTAMPQTYGTSYVLYESANDDESVVVVELATREVRETGAEAIALYRDYHETYRQAAVTGDDAVRMVTALAAERTHEAFPP